MNLLRKHDAICREVKRGRQPQCWRWANSDLWEIWRAVVMRKSIRAVRLTWVKGHATQQHLLNRVVTQRDAEGNS
eukprot:13225960-Alexandrium_andersonii.AAC.1